MVGRGFTFFGDALIYNNRAPLLEAYNAVAILACQQVASAVGINVYIAFEMQWRQVRVHLSGFLRTCRPARIVAQLWPVCI